MAEATPDPGSLLPLAPAHLHVLMALADGEKHGYAIMRRGCRLQECAIFGHQQRTFNARKQVPERLVARIG